MWHLLLVGSREKQDSKTESKTNTYPLIDLGGCVLPARGARAHCPSPAPALPRVIQVFWQSCSSQPLPSIPFQPLEDCPSLMQMSQLEALTAEAGEWGGGVQRSQGWRRAGSAAWKEKKKMHWAALHQCFAAVKWSVLYFSERRFYSVCRSRLKCTQVRWQISWCAWFYFYGRHCMRIGYFHSLRRLAVPSPLKGSLN